MKGPAEVTDMEDFSDIAAHEFSFLSELGYREMERRSDRLKLENASFWISIGWSRNDGEVWANFGFLPYDPLPAAKLTDRDLMSKVMGVTVEQLPPWSTLEVEKTRPLVSQLAANMRQHGMSLLRGDRAAYAELLQHRDRQAEERTRRHSRI